MSDFRPEWLDLGLLVFIGWRTLSGRSRSVGDSLHGLIALLLLYGLLLGARLDHWLKHALAGLASSLGIPPGPGLSLALMLGVWVLMRLLRRRMSGVLQRWIPLRLARSVVLVSELGKAVMVAGLLVYVLQWFYPESGRLPLAVSLVRHYLT